MICKLTNRWQSQPSNRLRMTKITIDSGARRVELATRMNVGARIAEFTIGKGFAGQRRVVEGATGIVA